jgi:hypothetical protein
MIKQRTARRPAVRQAESDEPPPRPPRKLALSGLAERAVISFGERGHQRRTLINILILAQALLLLAAAPGYLGSRPATVALIAVGLGLLVCVVSWIFNQFFRDASRAAYILVFGSSAAVLAQVFVVAINGNAILASQTALLLLAVILDAALLFSPEATLIAAGTAIALTIVALLLALALGKTLSRAEIYALVEGSLGLLSVTGLIAWLLAQFVYDSAIEAQRARDLQFAQARLDALVAQSAEQRRRLEAATASVQQAIARATSGDFSARVSGVEGELSALATGLNRLLERLQAGAPGSFEGQRQDSYMGPSSVPLAGNAAYEADAQGASLPRRLARVQELAGEIVGALIHSQDGLNTMAQTTAEALRTVGASLAGADGMLTGAQRGAELAGRARRALAAILSTDAEGQAGGDARARDASGLEPSEAAALLGLGPDLGVGPGMTGAFSILGTVDVEPAGAGSAAAEAAAAPELHVAVPAAGASDAEPDARQSATEHERAAPSGGKRRRGAKSAAEEKGPALPPELAAELQQALDNLHDEAVRQERTASTLTHDLGIMNRNIRGVDIGVSWTRQALEAVRRNAEKLYQTVGGGTPPPMLGDPTAAAHPLPPDMPMRAPTATRPLAESARLGAGPLAPGGLAAGLGGAAAGRAADVSSPAPGELRAADLLADLGATLPEMPTDDSDAPSDQA